MRETTHSLSQFTVERRDSVLRAAAFKLFKLGKFNRKAVAAPAGLKHTRVLFPLPIKPESKEIISLNILKLLCLV